MVAFYLNHPKRGGKLQQVSIYGRVSRSKAEFFDIPTKIIGLKVSQEYWDYSKQRVTARHPNAAWINAHLNRIAKEISDLYLKNLDKGWDAFRALALGTPTLDQQKGLLLLYDEFLESLAAERSQATLKVYRAVRPHLQQFPTITAETADHKFTQRFRAHLFALNLQDTTVAIYMSKLRELMKWLKKTGHLVHDAYTEWKCNVRDKPPIPLHLDELERFQSFILPKEESIARDYMCLESRIAARFSNTSKFHISQVVDNRWTYRQKKMNRIRAKEVSVDFTWWYIAPALDIISKHPEGRLPDMSVFEVNRILKRAGKRAGLNRMVTREKWTNGQCELIEVPLWKTLHTHTGRATFITIGMQYLPAKLVKDMAGIESWATLKNYEGPSEGTVLRQQIKVDNERMKAKAG